MVVEAPRYLGTGEGQTPILSGGDKRFECRNECPSKVRLALLARGGGHGHEHPLGHTCICTNKRPCIHVRTCGSGRPHVCIQI